MCGASKSQHLAVFCTSLPADPHSAKFSFKSRYRINGSFDDKIIDYLYLAVWAKNRIQLRGRPNRLFTKGVRLSVSALKNKRQIPSGLLCLGLPELNITPQQSTTAGFFFLFFYNFDLKSLIMRFYFDFFNVLTTLCSEREM